MHFHHRLWNILLILNSDNVIPLVCSKIMKSITNRYVHEFVYGEEEEEKLY